MLDSEKTFLGIDAGSVAVSVVRVDFRGGLRESRYLYHQGKPREVLRQILSEMDLSSVAGVAHTSGAPESVRGSRVFDSRLSVIRGARDLYGDFRSLLQVGGEKFALYLFDDQGGYLNMKSNTSCAAGTGGFLDQQAKRLNLSGSAALSERAEANRGEVPKIASRCSVFAKTDIIHAQQEGYSLEEICDGLCRGLAHNIVDTLFTGQGEYAPLVFCGGVALNRAVMEHLTDILKVDILTDPRAHLAGALGAAALMREEEAGVHRTFTAADILPLPEEIRTYHFDPLELTLSDYPDFDGQNHYLHPAFRGTSDVEVDIYRDYGEEEKLYLGIDIGSTSTKAVIIGEDREPVAGFYTRTAGRPILAVQNIFAACDAWREREGKTLLIGGAGTTGSGRKFIGAVVGADTVLDEISAHARAAYHLNPRVDTIIEIGGQDAKFTTLKNGVVTFSQMNTVCAAGTGSFIEEQALKLGVSLSDYAGLAEGARAPLASDRCTVFMERDINHFLNKNYQVPEILATVLFSVRENYLQKVATEGSIGDHVFFQGATAKNRALVAAFEQKLQKPIMVSRYCHLTGALGAALTAAEETAGKSRFRGLELFREDIPVRTEACELCRNNCRIRIATVGEEEAAYGFLCGRDYQTKKFVRKNLVPTLLEQRRKALAVLEASGGKGPGRKAPGDAAPPAGAAGSDEGGTTTALPVVGLPAGLQIFEELPLWRRFFALLGIPTVTSEDVTAPVSRGKQRAGAEFCSPMAAFYAHVERASEKSDLVFLPIHIGNGREAKKPARLRKVCYYTQFSTTLTSRLKGSKGDEIRSLRPLVNHRANILTTKYELLKSLNAELGPRFKFGEVSRAYDEALEYHRLVKAELKRLYLPPAEGEVKVVLLGRPYTLLQSTMNKDIPDYFAALGVETFFQDSLPAGEVSEPVDLLLDQFHWAHPAAILEAADFCVRTPGLYPVFVTSFKCSPDSFALEYFKRILDEKGKPYLILQIDDHDSSVGYETRIEAGVRAFRNHLKAKDGPPPQRRPLPIVPRTETSLKGKTLLLPNWDPLVLPLVAANLRNAGVDARVLEETPQAIAASMKMNTGQCIPINAIAHEYVEYIRTHDLNPEQTVLWMMKSQWACNIPLYPGYIKSLIEKEGGVGELAGVYTGELTMVEISPVVAVKTYFAYMFGGNLKKIGCMIRPYEINPGETDRVVLECRGTLEQAFLGELGFTDAVKQVMDRLDQIPRKITDRPKVAVFGDLYVRDNEVMNQNLIRCIEDAGGEALLTPYNDYAKIISGPLFKRWLRELRLPGVVLFKSLLAAMELLEGRYHGYLGKYIGKATSSRNPLAEEQLARFNIRIEQEGESYENLLKIFHIMKEHPDVALFVQTNPAFCCPSLVTEAMSRDIEEITGVPVVSITYDGTEAPKNDVIIPYLKFAGTRKGRKEAERPGLPAV